MSTNSCILLNVAFDSEISISNVSVEPVITHIGCDNCVITSFKNIFKNSYTINNIRVYHIFFLAGYLEFDKTGCLITNSNGHCNIVFHNLHIQGDWSVIFAEYIKCCSIGCSIVSVGNCYGS